MFGLNSLSIGFTNGMRHGFKMPFIGSPTVCVELGDTTGAIALISPVVGYKLGYLREVIALYRYHPQVEGGARNE